MIDMRFGPNWEIFKANLRNLRMWRSLGLFGCFLPFFIVWGAFWVAVAAVVEVFIIVGKLIAGLAKLVNRDDGLPGG